MTTEFTRLMDEIDYPSWRDRERVSDCPDAVRADAENSATETDPVSAWLTQFLTDRQTRKPSAHTMKAYRQDFVAIASLITHGDPAGSP
jgi:hypothetical protein